MERPRDYSGIKELEAELKRLQSISDPSDEIIQARQELAGMLDDIYNNIVENKMAQGIEDFFTMMALGIQLKAARILAPQSVPEIEAAIQALRPSVTYFREVTHRRKIID